MILRVFIGHSARERLARKVIGEWMADHGWRQVNTYRWEFPDGDPVVVKTKTEQALREFLAEFHNVPIEEVPSE